MLFISTFFTPCVLLAIFLFIAPSQASPINLLPKVQTLSSTGIAHSFSAELVGNSCATNPSELTYPIWVSPSAKFNAERGCGYLVFIGLLDGSNRNVVGLVVGECSQCETNDIMLSDSGFKRLSSKKLPTTKTVKWGFLFLREA